MIFGQRPDSVRPGAGPYEAWMSALRLWPDNPSVLATRDLPPLDVSTFDRQTWGDVQRAINDALERFMRKWTSELSAAIGRAPSTHELARSLVAQRQRLGPRFELIYDERLPEPIRDALYAGFSADLADLQRQIERSLSTEVAAGRSLRTENDRLLRVVRENTLVRALDDYPRPTSATTTEAAEPQKRARLFSRSARK